jgi:type IV pilus assembly protein PilQ
MPMPSGLAAEVGGIMNSRTWWGLWCFPIVLAWSIGTEARGQEGEGMAGRGNIQFYLENPAAPAPAEDSEYINLDVKDKDLNEVLKFISQRVGVNIIADSNVKETVTVTFDRVEWRHALKVIAEQTHCKVVEVSSRLIRFTQPPSISMEFQDADIKVVLDLLAKQAGANILINQDIQAKVTLSLRDVPWREALDALVKTAGYTVVRAGGDSTNEILRVVRPESLREQLETRHFTLRYIRPDEPYRAIIAGVETFAKSSIPKEDGAAAAAAETSFTLEGALRGVVSPEMGSLHYDPHTNTFIVKDTRPKLDEIENIILRIDVRPPQVYVEVKFIRTTNADILERGVKFDLPSTPERDGFQLIARGAGVGEFDNRLINAPGGPIVAAQDPLNIFGGTFPFNIGRPDRGALGVNTFQALGILDFTQTRLLLRLIKDDERSRIVQEPSLTLIDNKAGVIFVGETIPFAVQKIEQDQNGNITVAIDENKRSPINVGFTLYLVPHVIPGTDMINLSVIPKVSSLSGTTSSIEGFERFEFQAEGAETRSFIDLPRELAQTVVTYLRVQDGHTAVIGGLQTERRTEIETRVPLLSSIPILGNLFTWKRRQNTVESLLILITPHILKNVQEEDHAFGRAIERHQKTDYFYNKYEKDGVKEDKH